MAIKCHYCLATEGIKKGRRGKRNLDGPHTHANRDISMYAATYCYEVRRLERMAFRIYAVATNAADSTTRPPARQTLPELRSNVIPALPPQNLQILPDARQHGGRRF